MKDYIIDIPENYYISEYPLQWMVQISVNGKRITKNFSFRKFGSKEIALIKAKEYRDDIVRINKIN